MDPVVSSQVFGNPPNLGSKALRLIEGPRSPHFILLFIYLSFLLLLFFIIFFFFGGGGIGHWFAFDLIYKLVTSAAA